MLAHNWDQFSVSSSPLLLSSVINYVELHLIPILPLPHLLRFDESLALFTAISENLPCFILQPCVLMIYCLSLIHISEPTRQS